MLFVLKLLGQQYDHRQLSRLGLLPIKSKTFSYLILAPGAPAPSELQYRRRTVLTHYSAFSLELNMLVTLSSANYRMAVQSLEGYLPLALFGPKAGSGGLRGYRTPLFHSDSVACVHEHFKT